jgi:hypothetical protein
MTQDGNRPGIPLAKAIQDLRSELLAAMEEGTGKSLRFKLKPIELDLELALTWSGEANGGVKFWVVEFGAKGGAEKAATQRIKLVLDPVDGEGKAGFFVSDSSRKGLDDGIY